MPARDWFEGGHSFELTQESPLALKCAVVNDFHRAQCARHRPGQPNLAISAAPDHAQKFVIGNNWDLSGNLFGNGRNFTQATTARQLCRPWMSILAAEFFQRFNFLFQHPRHPMTREIDLPDADSQLV